MAAAQYFPLRWESTGDQWWFTSPIDFAAANGHYEVVRELLHLDTNLLIKLTSLRRIRRLESVWDDDVEQFKNVAKHRSSVAKKLFHECETQKGYNSLTRAGYSGWLMYTAAAGGDLGFIRELIGRDPLVVFGEGEYGVTDIFYAAARGGSGEVFRVVFECAEKCGGEMEGEVFRWEMVNRAVHAAARAGNLGVLREMIGDCKDVLVYRDVQGCTILHSASAKGQIQVVKHLLASYDIINCKDSQGNMALHVAAYRGNLPVVEILISESPSSAFSTNNSGDTFLHMAVAGFRSPGFRRVDRQIDLMKQLVCTKIFNIEDTINIQNKDGRTALHMAVIENIHSDLVELLMTVRWINLNIRDVDGMTPLDLLKRRPKSASSEILIKRLISSGGISNCQDYVIRNALVSQIKMQGIGGSSPGTSFKVPDAEIVLYTTLENGLNEPECDTFSGEISNSVNNKKFSSRLRILLRGKKDNGKLEDYESLKSYSECGDFQNSPVPLRQRYSKFSSLPNNKRVYFVPSPSTKKKYAAGLMHGVLRVMPHLDVESSPASPFSESLTSSPISMDKRRGLENSFSGEKLKQASFNKRVMNKYLRFGAQGLAAEEPGRPIV